MEARRTVGMNGTRNSSLWAKFTLLIVAAVYWFCIAQLASAGSMGQRCFPVEICASGVLKC